jgi:hypothetical protein
MKKYTIRNVSRRLITINNVPMICDGREYHFDNFTDSVLQFLKFLVKKGELIIREHKVDNNSSELEQTVKKTVKKTRKAKSTKIN